MSRAAFHRRVRKHSSVFVRCPECLDELLFRQFYPDHAKSRHDLGIYNRCVFCLGKYCWTRGEKGQKKTWDHLVSCMETFVRANRIRKPLTEPRQLLNETSEPVNETRDETSHWCETCKLPRPRDLMGRVRDRTSEYVGLYESVFEKPDVWKAGDDGVENGVVFDERCGLGEDAYWIVKRFERGDMNWYHVMVKHNAFDTFVREMSAIRDRFVLLPFWCLCDGLKEKDGQRRTHRHMIAACDQSGEFERVWVDRVKYPLKCANKKAKVCVQIRDELHLARAIAYVSSPKASCDRGIPGNALQDEWRGTSHFHVNRPLCSHAIAFLCTLFRGGIERLLLEQNRNKDVIDWADEAVRVRNKWAVPIRVTGWKFAECAIPVARRFEPIDDRDERGADFYVYLYGDKTLRFRANAEWLQMSDAEWRERQIRGGNTFLSIRDELYVLSRRQQNVMNQVKRMEKTTRRQTDDFWRLKLSQNGSRWKAKLRKVEEENVALKNENVELKRQVLIVELNALKSQLSAVESELGAIKSENAKLRAENAELRAENAKLKVEIVEWKCRFEKLDARLVNLELENTELKKMLADKA